MLIRAVHTLSRFLQSRAVWFSNQQCYQFGCIVIEQQEDSGAQTEVCSGIVVWSLCQLQLRTSVTWIQGI